MRVAKLRPGIITAVVALAVSFDASAKDGEYVYLRTNPIAIGLGPLSMAPIPQGGAPMHYGDLAGLGFSVGQFEFALNLASQNLMARPGEYGAFVLRFTTYWRLMKEGRLRFVEPFVLAGLGGGSAGKQVLTDAACTGQDCAYQAQGFGGGPHLGVGFDVNIPLVEMSNKQRVIAFVGLELRQELFFHQGPNTFTVISLPIGIRLD